MSGFNIVTFQQNGSQKRIALALESAFELKGGVEPDINQATCSYLEYANLNLTPDSKGNVDLTGTLGFWQTNAPSDSAAPDLSIAGVSIVDIDVADVGITSDTKTQANAITSYRLYIADMRQRFVMPRGGRLEVGLVNPTPIESDGGVVAETTDGDGNVAGTSAIGTTSLVPTSDLIRMCLDAMGLTSVTVPTTVDGQIPPPRGLQWHGNHAPTELAKLMVHCGHVFVPLSDGTAAIHQLGDGDAPTIPDGQLILDVPHPGIDRRGKTVVFTSYPNANLITQDVWGPSDVDDNLTWEFVAQDSNLEWVRIEDLTCCHQPLDFFHSGFITNSPALPADSARLKDQLYRFLRFRGTSYTADEAPILNRVVETDGTNPLVISGFLATQTNGVWSNSQVNITCINKYHLGNPQSDIIESPIPLGKVGSGQYPANFTPFEPLQFKIRCTFEDVSTVTTKSGKSLLSPSFFSVGFQQAVKSVTKLGYGTTDLANAKSKSDPDTIFISRPEWNLISVYPPTSSAIPSSAAPATNQTQLEAEAAALAVSYLKDSGSPMHVVRATGFVAAELNGQIAEINIDQQALTTSFKLNTWWSAAAGMIDLKQHASRSEGGGSAGGASYPNQHSSAASRTALGMSGATQPVTPLYGGQTSAAVSPGIAPYVMYRVALQISKINPGLDGNVATGLQATWKYDVRDSAGNLLLSAASVESPRPLACGTVQAIAGDAYNDAGGIVHLCHAYESFNIVGRC